MEQEDVGVSIEAPGFECKISFYPSNHGSVFGINNYLFDWEAYGFEITGDGFKIFVEFLFPGYFLRKHAHTIGLSINTIFSP